MSNIEETSLVPELDYKQQRFVHLYLTGNYKNTELAELFEVHPNTITLWLRKPAIKKAIETLQEDIHNTVASTCYAGQSSDQVHVGWSGADLQSCPGSGGGSRKR